MNIYKSAIIFSILCIVIASCESHEQKSEESFSVFKEDNQKMRLNSDTLKSNTISEKSEKTIYVTQKGENTDEWTIYKKKIETVVDKNDNQIKNLKSITDLNVKVYKKVAGLEKENYEIRKQITQYIIDEKTKRDLFIKGLIYRVSDIDTSLNVITKEQRTRKK